MSGQQASSPLKKGTPKQLDACPLHSVPLNEWVTSFLAIPLFLRPPLLCLSRPHELPPHMGCPFESGNQASSPLKKGTPKQFKACPLHVVLFPALNGPQHYMNSRPILGVGESLFGTQVLVHLGCPFASYS